VVHGESGETLTSVLTRRASSRLRCAAFPPVRRCALADHGRGEHGVGAVAELPEFLGGTAVLEDDLVGLEGVEFTSAKAVNNFANMADEFGQSSFVLRSHRLPCCLSLRLGGQGQEATDLASPRRGLMSRISYCAIGVEKIKGKPVTERDIQDWADGAERGYDVDRLRKRGRKPAGDGPGQVVPVRIDATLLAALAERAERDQVSRSEAIRAAIRAYVA
jgi:hypothetical protein